ncbi:MAG TPA: ferritin-like domain-containing protein [Thermomicrobiales bacterium]|nr:ferritin-like domain-containing protein [Thermomicrobiales bacterium]
MTMMAIASRAANHQFSRRNLIKSAGVVGLGMTLGQARLIRTLAQESEDLNTIINIASTAESLAVTLLGHAIESAQQGGYDKEVPDPVVNILISARAAEHYHLDYLLKAGAQPLTQTFTVPDPALLTSYDTFFTTVVQLEAAFIAAYIAAAREFTALKQPELVKVAHMVASVEAEHRVLANYALGTRPANNLAFEAATFGTVGEAAKALTDLGFINGTGQTVNYPGPGDIARGSIHYRSPYGPSVACITGGEGTPEATPGATPVS